MNTYLREFAEIVPEKWPTKGRGIHDEDLWSQAAVDLILWTYGIPRPLPSKTGSALAIARAGAPYGGSLNHEVLERLLVSMRDNVAAPLAQSLDGQEHFMVLGNKDETNAPYRGFLELAYCIGLLWSTTRSRTLLQPKLRDWLSKDLWMLEACEWPIGSGDVYPPGLRWHPGQAPPIFRDGEFLKALRGEPVDPGQRQMGHTKGSIMTGGVPVAANVWMALACREEGLLDGIKPKKPKLAHELVVERDDDGILAYFETMTGSDPLTVQAVQMRKGWKRPYLVLLPKGTPETRFRREDLRPV